jgi:hypothetical protein
MQAHAECIARSGLQRPRPINNFFSPQRRERDILRDELDDLRPLHMRSMVVRSTSCRAEAAVEVREHHLALARIVRRHPDIPVEDIVDAALGSRQTYGRDIQILGDAIFEGRYKQFLQHEVAAFAFDAVQVHRQKRLVMLLTNAGAGFPPVLADHFEGTIAGHGRALAGLHDGVGRRPDGRNPDISGGTCDHARPQMGAALPMKDGALQ